MRDEVLGTLDEDLALLDEDLGTVRDEVGVSELEEDWVFMDGSISYCHVDNNADVVIVKVPIA
jgi:hypothetical protein